MAKTYRIVLEYTTIEDMSSGPDYWDWPELLDLDIVRETFGLVSVARLPHVNEDHVREIRATNQEMLQA
jgi:hypothetical protein